MYHPTSRVLTVLELLQARPSISGPELAARLETDVRTVRRYIAHLQDVGIPIEATAGRTGGYRLRPGYKLPPLIFTEEEATAVMLGLLASEWLEVGQSPAAIEGALAKLARVLPVQAKERLQALSSHLALAPHHQQPRPDAALLIDISTAIHDCQRVAIHYRSGGGETSQRKVDPYGVVGWQGRWYLVGYCCLRREYRTFRVDRIVKAELLAETFVKAADFDYEAYVKDRHRSAGALMEVEFQVDLATVQQKIPVLYGSLTETTSGVLLQERYDDVTAMARYLMALDLPFVIRNPPELRLALLRLGERMVQIATVSPVD